MPWSPHSNLHSYNRKRAECLITGYVQNSYNENWTSILFLLNLILLSTFPAGLTGEWLQTRENIVR